MRGWRKYISAAAAGLLLWSGLASAYTGSCGIWYMKKGDFVMTNVSGDQTGFDGAKAAIGNSGFIFVHPGCSGITVGSLADSVTVTVHEGGTFKTYSGAKVRGAPAAAVVGDYLIKDGGLLLEDPGAGTNTLKFLAPTLSGNYTMTLPTANASGFLNNNGSGTLSWASGTNDSTNLLYTLGRTNGQTVLGSNRTSSTSTSFLLLRGYNDLTNSGTASLLLNQDANLSADNINFTERGQATGLNLNLGVNFSNTTNTGSLTCYGIGGNTSISGSPSLAVQNGTSTSISSPTFVVKAKTSQTGKLTEWRDASNNVVAYIDAAGNFSGSLGSSQKIAADTVQAYKTFLGGDVVGGGKGVFPDSIRAGTANFTGDCNVNFGKWAVRDSIRGNAGLQIGGIKVSKIDGNTATLNFGVPGAVPGSVDLTITVTGAAIGNVVMIGAPVTVGANYLLTGFVSAANTVTIRWTQIAGAAADPDGGGGTYKAVIFQ